MKSSMPDKSLWSTALNHWFSGDEVHVSQKFKLGGDTVLSKVFTLVLS